MAFRKHRAGQIAIEQTRDLARVRKLLEQGKMPTDGVEWPSACYLLAFDGDDAVGVVGVEPILDSALLRSLYVDKQHRRCDIGRRLVTAARQAAHARGARQLYLFGASAEGFFCRVGFKRAALEELSAALKGSPQTDYYLARPQELAAEVAYRLDISRDGIIER
ncbi:MAG TPA: GNAT family N-acetyltransferase [Candidatus Binataceae bacterium]|nr:GNAT family N-acetyltransferase [Candidatus Binataceae bacterium]